MDKKKIAFIINPISGTSDKKDLPELILSAMDSSWERPTIVYTQYAGEGKKLARQFADQRYDVVVACGGDGTMNEIASALIGTETAFGIVPYGSGNGLARHLGISMIPRRALKQLAGGEIKQMDYCKVNGIPFFCTCGTGFDAHISHAFANCGERGFFSYLKVIVKEYFSYKPYRYKIQFGNTMLIRKAFLITFANASQYGNMAYIAPHASVMDGKIDICIMGTFPVYSIPKLAWDLFTKKFDTNRHVTVLQTNNVHLSRPFEGEFHIDGEPIQLGKELDVEVVPLGLKILV